MFEAKLTARARATRLVFTSVASVLLWCLPLAAHEYWIEADDYSVSQGDKIAARLIVGQMMDGIEVPRLSRQIKSFQYFASDIPTDAAGREGDRPALVYEAKEPGLHVIVQETLPLAVTFETLEEFGEYLEYEGLERFVAIHQERGLPATGFSETYARFAKALVQVGPVEPGDRGRQVGLAFELTALENPYAGQSVLPVRLTWQGGAEANTQISVFRQLEGEVERSLVSTGPDGRAEIPLHEAGGLYLLNAVHFEATTGNGAVWESSWASLTFEAPSR